MEIKCQDCLEPFSGTQEHCPHCGRPSLFPNVTAASQSDEVTALEGRYDQACQLASQTGCDGARQQLESVVRSGSKAVISTNFNELERLSQSECNVFSTYYKRIEAGLQIPKGGKWDVLRGVAEHALFPGYKDHIRFGALSLDGVGVRNYGECSIELKESMVAHRTSLFEDNNVVFTVYDRKTTMADAEQLEKGHRCAWSERHKLCVAKLAPKLKASMLASDFAGLVLEQGPTTRDDRFVELHIWGSLTTRSMRHVRIHRRNRRPLKAMVADVRRSLQGYGIDVDES